MALRFSTTLRNNRLDQITTQVSTQAGSAGKLIIYDGTAPANLTDSVAGTQVLATFTMSHPFAVPASGGGLTVTAPADVTAIKTAAGAGASFFRITKSDNTVVIQGTVTDVNGSGDLKLNSVAIQSGATVSITSFTITEGNA